MKKYSPDEGVSRRRFLGAGVRGLGSWALAALPGSGAAEESAADRRPPLLMPDDFTDLHLVSWRVEPGTQDRNNPLLEGDRPWDAGGVGIHGSVFRDPLDRRWKAYLVCTPAEETPEDPKKPQASENHAHR